MFQQCNNRPKTFAVIFAVTAVGILSLNGCSRVPEGNARAGGQINFKDGRKLTGVVGVVRFDPESLYTGGSRGASVGSLRSDGSFQMMTRTPGDGVPIGDYRVVLVVQNADGSPADAVHFDYKHFETTPWRAHVEVDGENEFEFVLDPADERPLKPHDLPAHDY
jgi:hypothetical protein